MKRTPNTGSKRATKQAENDEIAKILLAMGAVDRNTYAAITGKGLSVYWRPSAWITGSDGRQPAYWNPVFAACVRLGIACEFVRDEDGNASVTFTELPEAWAEAQRDELIENNKQYRAKLRARKAEKEAVTA
jgi:hypothetical protein